MKNQELVQSFADGKDYGQTGALSIGGDVLFSYAMPIAKRLADGSFEVSNNTVGLGGVSVSHTTSCHIGLAYHCCKPNTLVNKIER